MRLPGAPQPDAPRSRQRCATTQSGPSDCRCRRRGGAVGSAPPQEVATHRSGSVKGRASVLLTEKKCCGFMERDGILAVDIHEKLYCFEQTEEGRRFWRGRRPSSAFGASESAGFSCFPAVSLLFQVNYQAFLQEYSLLDDLVLWRRPSDPGKISAADLSAMAMMGAILSEPRRNDSALLSSLRPTGTSGFAPSGALVAEGAPGAGSLRCSGLRKRMQEEP